MKTKAPYGTWISPLHEKQVAEAGVRLAEVQIDQRRVFWLEGRPQEQGRNAIVMRTEDGINHDILPAAWAARSKVHEYGGGAFVVSDNNLYFVNNKCQQVYHLNILTGVVSELTNTPNLRYGNLTWDNHHRRLIAVCEDHSQNSQAPTNTLVSIDIEHTASNPTVLVSGYDFYAYPTPSENGKRLAYIAWNNPNMPWQNSALWCSTLTGTGEVKTSEIIPTGNSAVFQPLWLNPRTLVWVDDSSGWWNIHKWDANFRTARTVLSMEAEFATPLWTLNMSTIAKLDDSTLLTAYTQDNRWQLATLNINRKAINPITMPLCSIESICTGSGMAAFIGAGVHSPKAVYHLTKPQTNTELHHKLTPTPMNGRTEDIAVGTPFKFETSNNQHAYANYYAPTNSKFEADEGALPPAIFIGHSGPTGQTDLAFASKTQFWTSRGFAIVEVNYRGSTGYGREFKNLLDNNWGISDVEDMIYAARHAINAGWVHPDQLAIKGSSAGGFSVLATLVQSSPFKAGVSIYGVADLESLAKHTHKFEAHYLDSLVGPYPEQKEEYIARSPVHHASKIQCPLLVFQGLEDTVVPPEQAQAIVTALRAQKVPVHYETYEDEGHGFRKASTIVHQLETELAFYKDVFDLHN